MECHKGFSALLILLLWRAGRYWFASPLSGPTALSRVGVFGRLGISHSQKKGLLRITRMVSMTKPWEIERSRIQQKCKFGKGTSF